MAAVGRKASFIAEPVRSGFGGRVRNGS